MRSRHLDKLCSRGIHKAVIALDSPHLPGAQLHVPAVHLQLGPHLQSSPGHPTQVHTQLSGEEQQLQFSGEKETKKKLNGGKVGTPMAKCTLWITSSLALV